MRQRSNYDSDIPEGHPAQEKRVFYPNDVLLRLQGFKIHGRPKGSEARWTKDGKLYLEKEALALAEDLEAALAAAVKPST